MKRQDYAEVYEIQYKHLSWSLKVAVVAAWATLIYLGLSFLIGFAYGMVLQLV